MAAGVSPDDPWAREVALRYTRLCDQLGSHLPSEFTPLDGSSATADRESLDELRHSIDEYLILAGAEVPTLPPDLPRNPATVGA